MSFAEGGVVRRIHAPRVDEFVVAIHNCTVLVFTEIKQFWRNLYQYLNNVTMIATAGSTGGADWMLPSPRNQAVFRPSTWRCFPFHSKLVRPRRFRFKHMEMTKTGCITFVNLLKFRTCGWWWAAHLEESLQFLPFQSKQDLHLAVDRQPGRTTVERTFDWSASSRCFPALTSYDTQQDKLMMCRFWPIQNKKLTHSHKKTAWLNFLSCALHE